MYDQFRAAFAVNLDKVGFPAKAIEMVLSACDQVSTGYNIEKNNALVTVSGYSDELLKTFIVCKKIEGLSDGSLKNYYLAIKNFFGQVHKLPNDVTANDIRAYLYWYQHRPGKHQCTDRSLDKVRQYLRLFFAWANNERYIETNPCMTVKAIRFEEKQREAMSQVELEHIRNAAETAKEKAIVEVLYSTGCRAAELCGLKLSDVDLKDGTVHLFGKGKKHRTSYLNAKAVVALESYISERNGDNDWLFQNDRKPYGQMKNANLERIVAKIVGRSGVEANVTPHVFRHTTATHAIQRGMPIASIQKMLGHSNISTTTIYAQTDQSSVHAEHLRCVV